MNFSYVQADQHTTRFLIIFVKYNYFDMKYMNFSQKHI